jgi:hypothetical protein
MSDKTEGYFDPLIDEVRTRRRAMLARYGNDPRAFFDAIEQMQATHPHKLADHRKIHLRALLKPETHK